VEGSLDLERGTLSAMDDTPESGDERRLLRIYLNDHRAGAVAGLRLARRCASRNADMPFAPTLEGIVHDIAEDAHTLQQIQDRLGSTPNRVKAALAATADFIGRLKLNGRILRYSPLSRLLETEALTAGIDAKRSLWRTLQTIDDAALRDFDLDSLERRATEQRERLLPVHQDAAQILNSRRPSRS